MATELMKKVYILLATEYGLDWDVIGVFTEESLLEDTKKELGEKYHDYLSQELELNKVYDLI